MASTVHETTKWRLKKGSLINNWMYFSCEETHFKWTVGEEIQKCCISNSLGTEDSVMMVSENNHVTTEEYVSSNGD